MQNLQHAQTCLTTPTFKSLINFLEKSEVTKAAILFGSVARKEDNYHSDVDLALWVNDSINKQKFVNDLKNSLGRTVYITNIPRKNSICLYSNDIRKIDIMVVDELKSLNRNYLGSNIPSANIQSTIIFDKTDKVYKHLKAISSQSIQSELLSVDSLIDYFVFNFENCSKQHAKSDGYQFYFNYNIAFHTFVQLKYIAEDNSEYVYNPKNFINTGWKKGEEKKLYDLSGTIFLVDANTQKRKLIEQFYKVLKKLRPAKFETIQSFCESIIKRDMFWNFRDYNIHASTLPSGKLFRSASFTIVKDAKVIIDSLAEKNIKTIVDLRAPREKEASKYPEKVLENVNYIEAPFDPWNQPKWFQESDNYGTNREIAYRFFLKGCQSSFKETINSILQSDGATVIHCVAGKDRTGLIIGAIQLLLGVDRNTIETDYLASGMDVNLNVFKILFEEVNRHGGIKQFFEYQGIPEATQIELVKKLRG